MQGLPAPEENQVDKLTIKQEIFCQDYVIHFNGARAAIKAGYAPDNANVIAFQNLRKPHIIGRINEIKENILQEIGITQGRVFRELARIAFFDIREAYTEEGALKPIRSINDNIAAAIISLKTYDEIGFDENGKKTKFGQTKEVKFADKLTALAQIIKIAGWNAPEKINIDANISARPINFE
jgi:phage terminase small subunit